MKHAPATAALERLEEFFAPRSSRAAILAREAIGPSRRCEHARLVIEPAKPGPTAAWAAPRFHHLAASSDDQRPAITDHGVIARALPGAGRAFGGAIRRH
jgi:hypothetical protein